MYFRRFDLSLGGGPMSQKALPITVTTRVSLRVRFLADWMCKGNRVRVQPKTVLRISHHCCLAGTSTTTVPGLFPVASLSAKCRSPSASIFTATTRPVRAYQLFSIPVRSDCHSSCTPMLGQLTICEGVVD